MPTKRTHNVGQDSHRDAPANSSEIVDLADARTRLNSRPRLGASREALLEELQAVRVLLDQGRSIEVKTRVTSLIAASRQDAS